MPFIEAPTTFYLGRHYNPRAHRLDEDIVYYDSRDLTTHAVVVGMTGSGKTGLCITLLEEAILDNIPSIIIDPKGDITNLLLTFPDLRPSDFEPWVNPDEARRAGLDLSAYAADVARRWREGLQSWGIVPDRVRWLKLAARYSIYTPGSDAGLPISILASLRAPRGGWEGNEEENRERINGTVTALLALIGLNVEPVKDKEHVLIANIFEYAWRRGIDLTLEDIIMQVQRPPFDKLGVFPVDDYMSERARAKLAMDLNSIIASPSFQSWIHGEPLDIQSLLYQPNGRPKVSVFYIAHLTEAERQFIITLLTENMLGWMRTLSGTTSLRALFYIDEMFGYFPPHPRNPPTKEPILRLLKQARAFGLGLILATQNPGDLDYKGLTNAGTWFIGRLQTENDRRRVMTGLEGMATADNGLNTQDVARLIADIEPRVFLMHNVHDTGGPSLVHTRWAMNYLAGPLTRQQIGILMAQQRQELMGRINTDGGGGYANPNQRMVVPTSSSPPPQQQAAPPMPPQPTGPLPPQTLPGTPPQTLPGFNTQAAPPPMPLSAPPGHSQNLPVPTGSSLARREESQWIAPGVLLPDGYLTAHPPVPSSIQEYFLAHRLSGDQAISEWQRRTNFAMNGAGSMVLAYQPVLLAQAAVRYSDRKANIFTARYYTYKIPDVERSGIIHWEDHVTYSPVDPRQLLTEAPQAAIYGALPTGLTDPRRVTALQREMIDMLYNTARLHIPHNPTLKLYANPDVDESEFFAQAAQVAREGRDAEIDKVTAQFEKEMDRLDDRRTKMTRSLSARRKELADRRREQTFTQGEALLSILRGRTTYTLSRTSRARRWTRQTEENLQEDKQLLRDLDQQMDQLEQRFEEQLRLVNEKWAKIAHDIQDYVITPFKKDIHVELFGVGWLPHWYVNLNNQPLLLPAY
jgi:hypothetical protein